jgi:hypothetical protein
MVDLRLRRVIVERQPGAKNGRMLSSLRLVLTVADVSQQCDGGQSQNKRVSHQAAIQITLQDSEIGMIKPQSMHSPISALPPSVWLATTAGAESPCESNLLSFY